MRSAFQAAMSADLLWQVIGKNSAFIRTKANGKLFNAEPGHLTGLNSKSASTLCGAQTVALSVQKTGSKDTILLEKRTKGAKGAKKPKAAIAKTGVSKSTKKATASIAGAMDKKYYRRELQSKVEAKYARLRASMKTKKIEGHKSRSKKAD